MTTNEIPARDLVAPATIRHRGIIRVVIGTKIDLDNDGTAFVFAALEAYPGQPLTAYFDADELVTVIV